MTSARVIRNFLYGLPASSSGIFCSKIRAESSTHAIAMVAVVCLSGAKVRYKSKDMLKAVFPTVSFCTR